MKKSENIGELAKALSAFQADLPAVHKNSTVQVATRSGGSYNFAYATLDNIIETVRPHLKEHGLAFSQFVDDGGLTTIIMHTSGEWMEAHHPFDGIKYNDAQQLGSAITYLRRYELAAALGIAADEDDDGNVNAGNQYQRASGGSSAPRNGTQPKNGHNYVPKILEAAEKRWGDPAHWDELDKLTKGKKVKDLTESQQKRLLAHILEQMGEVVE